MRLEHSYFKKASLVNCLAIGLVFCLWSGYDSTNTKYADDSLQLTSRKLDAQDEPEQLTVCGRNADNIGSSQDFILNTYRAPHDEYMTCPEFDSRRKSLVIEGNMPYGQTGNQIITFIHALQYVRDEEVQLVITEDSWAMNAITSMWMVNEHDDWKKQMEKLLCVKIVPPGTFMYRHYMKDPSKKGRASFVKNSEIAEYLYRHYSRGNNSRAERVSRYLNILRTMFGNYNTGLGLNHHGDPVKDMCSGINAVFGDEGHQFANYTAIHHRYLDGEHWILEKMSERTGCDPHEGVDMTPEYIKAILEPIGMLKNPIVVMTDGQNEAGVQRLLDDPELGPMIHLVPEDACWTGGDVTLGVTANVFIGNPGSTFSGLIARTRMALGYGHSYLFMAKDEAGEWTDVCRDNCLFPK